MPILVRNSIAFPVAVAIYAGGISATTYIMSSFVAPERSDVWALILLPCAFGVIGHFLFQGKSRAVHVLLAFVVSAIALGFVDPALFAAQDARNARVQIILWISLGVVAAVTTNFAGWIAKLIKSDRAEATTKEVMETPGIEKQTSTLAYHLGRSASRWLAAQEDANDNLKPAGVDGPDAASHFPVQRQSPHNKSLAV